MQLHQVFNVEWFRLGVSGVQVQVNSSQSLL